MAIKGEKMTRHRIIIAGIICSFLTGVMATAQAAPLTDQPMGSLIFDVKDHGAKGDGKALDTLAIQSAIDAAHNAGGGTVLFAHNSTYLTGTIYLKSNVRIHVADHSKILGSRNSADYGTDTGVSPYYPEPLERCLIYAKNCSNITFSGKGTIHGGLTTEGFAVPGGHAGRRPRPMCIRFESCENIEARDQLWTGAWAWFSHFRNCKGIYLTGLRVLNKRQDGFNIESSQNIRVSDCHLECGDDAFAFTTSHASKPIKNVVIVNCFIRTRWAGVRFGPLGKGDFENVLISNCTFENCNGGGIKFDPLEGGEVRNCIFSDIVMDGVTAPIVMVTARWPDIGSTEEDRPLMPPGKISNIQFNNMIIKSKGAGPKPDGGSVIYLHGYKGAPIRNITFSNIDVIFPGGGTTEEAARRNLMDSCDMDWNKYGYWYTNKGAFGVPPAYGIYARHVEGLSLNNIRFSLSKPDERSALFLYQSSDISISELTTSNDPQAAAIVTAKDCIDVHLNRVRSRNRVNKKTPFIEE